MIVGLICLGLAATIAGTIQLSRDDPESTERGVAPTTQPATQLSGAAAELVRLVDAGAKLAFDARYTASQDGGGGAPSTLRVWQKPPLVRLDKELGSGAEIRPTAQFALPAGPVSCSRQPDGAWTCKSDPGLRLRSGVVPEGIVSQLNRVAVESRAERIGGEDARCFSMTFPAGNRADVCLTHDGVPVRVLVDSVRLELAQLDRSPPADEIFELPAPLS